MVRHTQNIVKVDDDMEEIRGQMMTSRISSVPTFNQNFMMNNASGLSSDYENMLTIQLERFGDFFQFMDEPGQQEILLDLRGFGDGTMGLSVRGRTARQRNGGAYRSFFMDYHSTGKSTTINNLFYFQVDNDIQDLYKAVRLNIIQYKVLFEKKVTLQFNANFQKKKVFNSQSLKKSWRWIYIYLQSKQETIDIHHIKHSCCFNLDYEIAALKKEKCRLMIFMALNFIIYLYYLFLIIFPCNSDFNSFQNFNLSQKIKNYQIDNIYQKYFFY